MSVKHWLLVGVAGYVCAVPVTGVADAQSEHRPATGLVQAVRVATADFRSVANATAAGYASMGSCVSGPQEGAMGIHYAKGELIFDGALDASHPELLMYEQRSGRLRLLGVEFIVIASEWHATNEGPPVLMGQHFQYTGSPNRYGLPAFYALHVWAWKENLNGMFADFNPRVSCEEYAGE